MRKTLISVIICSVLLAGCGSKASEETDVSAENNVSSIIEESEEIVSETTADDVNTEQNETEEKETEFVDCSEAVANCLRVDTTSTLRSSFLEYNRKRMVPDFFKEMLTVYLGHPRIMEDYEYYDGIWYTSDPEIATVENAIITGWKEGTCKIELKSNEGQTIETFNIIVTTFNDGKDANSFKVNETGYYRTDDASYTPSNPEWVRENCNTILDFIVYLQDRRFIYFPDAPIMVTGQSCWTWAEAGDIVLTNNYGVCCDVANAASYVLANDYERWGFVCITGAAGHIYNWFYEDGTFYIIDFTRVISDNRDNVQNSPESYMMMSFGADSPESEKELLDQFLECNTNYEHCFVSFWVEATGYDFQPATVLSWCHEGPYNADNKYIALEKEVLEERTIIGYVNPDVECDIKGIDIDLIPSIVPTYGTRSNQDEIDRWNRYYRY